MKFETLKKDYRKPILIIAGVAVMIAATVFFVGTRAKYRYTASFPAVQGTIHHKVGDLELLAVNIQQKNGSYTSSDTIPTSGYKLNTTKSYCGLSNGDGTYTHESNNITYENGEIAIGKLTKKGTKCFLYFDDICDKACKAILAANTIDTSRKSGNFTKVYTSNATGKIFEGPADDYGEKTYFFAGGVPNNWVQFAGKWWRIIRINGDGSVRLIYAGADATAVPALTGTGTQIQISAFNTSYLDNAYVGYMYGEAESSTYEATHANTNSSTVKGVLDAWYDNNIGNDSSYSNHIATNVGFCGDRSIDSSARTGLGYARNDTLYMAYNRLYTNKTPSLKCPNVTNDLYTTSSASIGNKSLTKPIGLITADEVSFAGAIIGSYNNTSYWLYTNQSYWTMTPYNCTSSSYVSYVLSTGRIGGSYTVDTEFGVRPVINLKADTVLTGSGTTKNPFVVA